MLNPVQDPAVSGQWLALSEVVFHDTAIAASMGPLEGLK
mgnify:FL=1